MFNIYNLSEKSLGLGLGLGLEIKSLALVLVLKIMEVLVLVLTTKSYLHHWPLVGAHCPVLPFCSRGL